MLQFKDDLHKILQSSLREFFAGNGADFPGIDLEVPNEKSHGDFSTNIALKSARVFKKAPLQLAEEFLPAIREGIDGSPLQPFIGRIEILRPGFINFHVSLSGLAAVVGEVHSRNEDYGRENVGGGVKVNIEFVSANPTGPLSVAHARQAAVGDALGNIFSFVGYDVTKEYYVNDEGNQINLLGLSVKLRAAEILGESVTLPEDCYQGEYIRDMAEVFLEQKKIKNTAGLEAVDPQEFNRFGVDFLMDVIKKELEDFGVQFDQWSHQSAIASADKTAETLAFLKKRDVLYEKDGALWFRTTQFGDDKDRVLKKSDGSFTYFAPDIAYHKDKFDRSCRKIVDILGPDHHGYIPRLTAAVEALGHSREDLNVLIVQLATIYRDGKPVSMSTRRGQYISLREVIDEVGTDAARFFFLMRHISAHLEFDLELAKKQSPENPVYYVQYAHARINSIMGKAAEHSLRPKSSGYKLLTEPETTDLIKKIGTFPDILVLCAKEHDPYALVSYLQELAAVFHKFYDQHRVVDPDQPDLSAERLGLILAVKKVLANGLHLLGLSAPEKM